jgi:hypothetical protein
MLQSLPRADQRRASEAYVSGLLRCPGKKSIRNIASASSVAYSDQALLQFVNKSGWDPAPVRRELANWLSTPAPTAWVVQEVAFEKYGRHSAAVERQYVPSNGRLSNCQLGVLVAVATQDGVIPVTWRLMIPRSWDADDLRRRKARIPFCERHQPSWRYQVEALDDLSGDWGLPLAPAVLDLRQSAAVIELANELHDRGLQFLMQVAETVPVHFRYPRRPPQARPGGDAAPVPPAIGSLGDLSSTLSALPRKTLPWRDPKTGRQVRGQFTCTPVQAGGVLSASRIPQVLLLEWGLGKPVPRAFWLSNMVDCSIEELVTLTRLQAQADVDIGKMIDQVGLCDYEGRSFLGWHHHVTLASVAYAFCLSNPYPSPSPVIDSPA